MQYSIVGEGGGEERGKEARDVGIGSLQVEFAHVSYLMWLLAQLGCDAINISQGSHAGVLLLL